MNLNGREIDPVEYADWLATKGSHGFGIRTRRDVYLGAWRLNEYYNETGINIARERACAGDNQNNCTEVSQSPLI